MMECRVELVARPAGLTPVAAGDQQAAVVEGVEFVGLGLNVVMATEPPPHLAPHRVRSNVLAAYAQRQTRSGMAEEIRMQQLTQRLPVAGGQRTVEASNGGDLRVVLRVEVVHKHVPSHRMGGSTGRLFNLDSAKIPVHYCHTPAMLACFSSAC